MDAVRGDQWPTWDRLGLPPRGEPAPTRADAKLFESTAQHVIASGAKQSPTVRLRLLRRCATRNDIDVIRQTTLRLPCHSTASGFRRGTGSTLKTACWHVTDPFIGHRHAPRAGTLAIQTGIGYNTSMVALQFIVVATLVSVLYVYLRQSNQD